MTSNIKEKSVLQKWLLFSSFPTDNIIASPKFTHNYLTHTNKKVKPFFFTHALHF